MLTQGDRVAATAPRHTCGHSEDLCRPPPQRETSCPTLSTWQTAPQTTEVSRFSQAFEADRRHGDIIPSRTDGSICQIESFARSNEVLLLQQQSEDCMKIGTQGAIPLSTVLPKTGAKPIFSLSLSLSLSLSPMDHIFCGTMTNPTRPVRPLISSISSSFRIVSRKSGSNLRSNEV